MSPKLSRFIVEGICKVYFKFSVKKLYYYFVINYDNNALVMEW